MLRLPLSLLLVSLVLAIDHSTDDLINRRNNSNHDSALTYTYQQRRRQQQPQAEIKEENAGRYFRRRPQTTTVSSIFSMKVENESQHVYPNMNPLENLHAQPNQEEINMADMSTTTTTQQPNFFPTSSSNNRRPNNVHRRKPYSRIRRPSIAQTTKQVVQQTEKIIEQVTSTTTATIIDITVKEQENVMLPSSETNFTNEVSSLKKPHSTISQIPESFIQRMKAEAETTEEVIMSTSNAPVVIYTTEKEPEKRVFTPSAAYVSNLRSVVKRRRPIFVQKTELPVIHQKEANEQSIHSPAAAVLPLVSIIRPKTRQPLNRGSHKYNRKGETSVQSGNLDSNSSHLTSTIPNTPPPVPTLSPWYDGYGK